MSKFLRLSRCVVFGALVVTVAACSGKAAVAPAKSPASPEEIRADAEQAARFGDHARAISSWQSLLQKNPDDPVALRGLGDVYLAAGAAGLALPVFEKVLSRDAADVDAQEGRGLALLALGRMETAREQLASVLAVSRQRWRSLNGMGLLLDMQGQAEAAQQHYRDAMALQPGHPLILNNMGYSRMMAQDYKAAEDFFREGLRSAPDGAYLHANFVLAIAWQGAYERALVEAVKRQPREEALNNIGYIALLKKDYRTAISYFHQAIDTSPRWYPRAAANLERARQESATLSAVSE